MLNITRSCLLVTAICLLLTACDSGDPIDEPHPREVAGRYNFSEFAFDPAGTAFEVINVLDTLVQSETELTLAGSGSFNLSYQFVNGEVNLVPGRFEVTARTVRLNTDDSFRDEVQRLLLSDEVTLRRSEEEEGVLTAEIPKTIDPSEFSDRYEGVTSMSGTLMLRLVQQ